MSRQQYLEPVPYFALNNDEVAALQREAGTLRSLIEARGTPWRDRENASARLKDIERRLQSARVAEKLDSSRNVANQDNAPRLIRSDGGDAFFLINASLDEFAE